MPSPAISQLAVRGDRELQLVRYVEKASPGIFLRRLNLSLGQRQLIGCSNLRSLSSPPPLLPSPRLCWQGAMGVFRTSFCLVGESPSAGKAEASKRCSAWDFSRGCGPRPPAPLVRFGTIMSLGFG